MVSYYRQWDSLSLTNNSQISIFSIQLIFTGMKIKTARGVNYSGDWDGSHGVGPWIVLEWWFEACIY